MENASKALIIAGAILLSILLISLGIMIFNQARGIASGSQMDSVEKETFNSKFTQYEGTRKGAEVKSMLQQVLASNGDEDNTSRKISVTVDGATAISTAEGANAANFAAGFNPGTAIHANTRYTITIGYAAAGNNAGLVNAITVLAVPN